MLEAKLREVIERLPAIRDRLARAGTGQWTVVPDEELRLVFDAQGRVMAVVDANDDPNSERLQFIVEAHNADIPDLLEAVQRLLEAEAPSESRPLKCCFTQCAGLVTFLTKVEVEWNYRTHLMKVPVCDMHGRILVGRLAKSY